MMMERIREFFSRPSRADLLVEIERLKRDAEMTAEYGKRVFDAAHFRDAKGKILPKGKIPPSLQFAHRIIMGNRYWTLDDPIYLKSHRKIDNG